MSKREKQVHTYRLITVILWSIGAIIIGFSVGYFIRTPIQVVDTHSIRENNVAYKFIRPLLMVDRTDTTVSPSSQGLYNSINSYIRGQVLNGSIINASTYFIDYSGKKGSFGINPENSYSPASLLKVVIMVAYLKESESDNTILNKELTYTSELKQYDDVIPFESPTELAVGQSYTVSSLVNRMIIDSDNGAKDLLLVNMDPKYLNQVYVDLGLTPPGNNPAYTISAKDYSAFFRVLYNATYLSDADSEKALSILSQATFANGLVEGVPADTVVAHKFGEYVNGTNDHIDSIELHDCGIIYPSGQSPYLLCVMTKGSNLTALQQVIASISKMVYTDVVGK